MPIRFTDQGPQTMLTYPLRVDRDGDEVVVTSPLVRDKAWRDPIQQRAIQAAKQGIQEAYEAHEAAAKPRWLREEATHKTARQAERLTDRAW